MKIFQKGLSAAVVFLLLCLTGCGAREMNQEGDRLRVVTTVFPYYDFTRQIAGDDAELTMVVPAGMDSHSFEPTPADMRLIQNADLLICNGGAMEHWLSEVLDAIDTSGMTVVTMMDYVDTFEEEMVEGMEGGHDHDHDHEAFELDEDGHREEIEYDEHIWTSPVNAMKMAEVICDVLSQMDPVHESSYKAREDAYQKELQAIDEGFRQVSENRKRSMIILGDKFPFRYLAEEYQLDYRAAFSGCSTDTEPSARTIAYLIDKVREKQIPVVYYLELSSHRVAEIIGEETGAQPLLLHSCHNVTRAQFDSGITYAELMRQNVENLRKGLDE
uniref:metal ABC transporter substrate-binding protein n=1 Tax=Candidatus Ventrimonas sp. TaxID=3048889 RepID=UPI003FEF21A3